MKRSDFMKRMGFKAKKSEDVTPEAVAPEVAAEAAAGEEVTDADIEAVIAENAALKQENAKLKESIEAEQDARLKAAVAKAVDGLNPSELFTGKLRDTVMGGVDTSKLKLKEDGDVEGIEELLEALQADYPGLFSEVASDAEAEAEKAADGGTPATDDKPQPATKARAQYAAERPAGQSSIKARANQVGSAASTPTKTRTPYATERAAQ